MSPRLSPFVPACVHFNPFCLCISSHAFHTCSCLCTCLHSLFPFAPACSSHHLCPFHLWYHLRSHLLTPLANYLFTAHLCQYLNQPAHYPEYLDQLSTGLLATFTAGLVFARGSKQGVAIPCFDQTGYFGPDDNVQFQSKHMPIIIFGSLLQKLK